MRCVTYARFSTDRQDEASIIDQQRVCREHAERRSWLIDGDYTDEGISGAAMGNRPGAIAALATVAAGDVLLIADITRLARSQDLAPMIERLRFRGVRVVGVLDGFDSDGPLAHMQAGLSGLISDDMRRNIRARTHSALKMRAQQQRSTGAKPYGYTVHGEIIEAEAVVVREIFARAADGDMLRTIAVDLNVRGVPAPGAGWERKHGAADGRWRISAIHALLGNDRYIGRLIWNRSQWVKDPDSGRRIRRERPEAEWVVSEGLRLVDDVTWSKVRARRSERQRVYGGGRGAPPRYLLSGLLTCGACGQRLVATGKNGAHYRCSTYRNAGTCTMKRAIRRDAAEHAILAPIREDLQAPDVVRQMVDLMVGWSRSERVETASPDLAKLDGEIAQVLGLIEERPALAGPLRETLQALQDRRTAAQRMAWRRASAASALSPDIAEAAYRDAVSNLVGALEGAILPARERLRGLLGDVPVTVVDGQPVAQVRLQLLTLVGVLQVGSGGPVWTRDILLVKRA